jgi:hypothetical protein
MNTDEKQTIRISIYTLRGSLLIQNSFLIIINFIISK